jgi:hypothetical protein
MIDSPLQRLLPHFVLISTIKPSRPGMREGGSEDADDFSGSPQRQNSHRPMDDNLALVEVFETVFRGLCDADGRVKHTLNIASDIH